jgi:hypothetical protein
MRSRIINILRSIFVSPEMLLIVIILAANCYMPSFVLKIGDWYKHKSDWATGVAINGGLLVFSLLQAKEVLFPINNSMGILDKWQGYVLLKDTTLIGVAFCFLATIAAFLIFIFKDEIGSGILGCFFLINLSVPMIAIATLFLAKINIKMFIEQSQKSNG